MIFTSQVFDLPQILLDTKISDIQRIRKAFNYLKTWDIRRNQIQNIYYDITCEYLDNIMKIAECSQVQLNQIYNFFIKCKLDSKTYLEIRQKNKNNYHKQLKDTKDDLVYITQNNQNEIFNEINQLIEKYVIEEHLKTFNENLLNNLSTYKKTFKSLKNNIKLLIKETEIKYQQISLDFTHLHEKNITKQKDFRLHEQSYQRSAINLFDTIKLFGKFVLEFRDYIKEDDYNRQNMLRLVFSSVFGQMKKFFQIDIPFDVKLFIQLIKQLDPEKHQKNYDTENLLNKDNQNYLHALGLTIDEYFQQTELKITKKYLIAASANCTYLHKNIEYAGSTIEITVDKNILVYNNQQISIKCLQIVNLTYSINVEKQSILIHEYTSNLISKNKNIHELIIENEQEFKNISQIVQVMILNERFI